ncbi:hypothetical protein BJ085DRAFT_28764 [Dimargaris cristalligena]|uniref:Uncharacterized protein n=1 Tax=Dimargaris cristalligena TaxID=215637 RepID=A0A4P9ZSR7_9FUNG|nr:hypothetical protein BJ085DRAFT_28764 [Dimargaris cristalligena]|eukprot:RKP35861.1 hypothetical protein BJ085DRAFT_28764 [Dimargaris cristalligena]
MTLSEIPSATRIEVIPLPYEPNGPDQVGSPAPWIPLSRGLLASQTRPASATPLGSVQWTRALRRQWLAYGDRLTLQTALTGQVAGRNLAFRLVRGWIGPPPPVATSQEGTTTSSSIGSTETVETATGALERLALDMTVTMGREVDVDVDVELTDPNQRFRIQPRTEIVILSSDKPSQPDQSSTGLATLRRQVVNLIVWYDH